MRLSPEDIQWLRILDLNPAHAIPAFNLSRLKALGLVNLEVRRKKPMLTDKGRELIAADPSKTG